MNLAHSPQQMALDVYAQWDADYVRRRRIAVDKHKAAIKANPASLGLAVAKWFAEEPRAVGLAVLSLLDGKQTDQDVALRMLIDAAMNAEAMERVS